MNQKSEDIKYNRKDASTKVKSISRWQQRVHEKSGKQRLNVVNLNSVNT